MNPNHTAPMEQSDLDPYCLQYRLPKSIKQMADKSCVLWAKG